MVSHKTKTIRFEKGEIYQHKDIPNFIWVESADPF